MQLHNIGSTHKTKVSTSSDPFLALLVHFFCSLSGTRLSEEKKFTFYFIAPIILSWQIFQSKANKLLFTSNSQDKTAMVSSPRCSGTILFSCLLETLCLLVAKLFHIRTSLLK